MTKFLSPDKVVNSNDNPRFHWIRTNEDRERYGPYVEFANRLINRHVAAWWKNHPETAEYQASHHWTCMLLEDEVLRTSLFQFLSVYLECSPLILANDPELRTFQQS